MCVCVCDNRAKHTSARMCVIEVEEDNVHTHTPLASTAAWNSGRADISGVKALHPNHRAV